MAAYSLLLPTSGLHRFGQFLAVDADLPGKKAVSIQFRFAEFCLRAAL